MKTPRQIAIADHLWKAYERMAEDMGSDLDALVNQAMHSFARLNGFVTGGAPGEAGAPEVTRPPPPEMPDPPELVQSSELVRSSAVLPGPERHAVAERVLETAARLERDMQDRTPPDGVGSPHPPTPTPRKPGTELYLLREDGSETPVAKERYVIGRGRHCDLVIDSGKVSREHAAVLRGSDGNWYIEDLGSSNGTWHERERIGRRRIDDGDEYFVCSERIRCELR